MRDYAKKSYRPVQKNNHANGQWLLVLLILSTIGFISTLAYHFAHEKLVGKKELKEQIAPIPIKPIEKPKGKVKNKSIKTAKKAITSTKKAAVVKKEKVIALNPADDQPKYDFYKLPPETTVVIPPQPAFPSPH